MAGVTAAGRVALGGTSHGSSLWVVVRAVKRAFKFRFYPSDAQAAELARTFGCVRKVYNMALAARTEAWTRRQERVNYNATSAMLTEWKKSDELAFLNEVSCVPLQQALRHLQVSFANFFAKRSRYPRFKSKKRSRRSAEYTRSAFRFRNGRLTLAKMTEPLNIVWSRPLPEDAVPSTVTVSHDAAGRWFVSLLCDDRIASAPAAGQVGIDAGLEHLLTLSTGEKITLPDGAASDEAGKPWGDPGNPRPWGGGGCQPTKSWVSQTWPLDSRTTLSPIRLKLLLSRFFRCPSSGGTSASMLSHSPFAAPTIAASAAPAQP